MKSGLFMTICNFWNSLGATIADFQARHNNTCSLFLTTKIFTNDSEEVGR